MEKAVPAKSGETALVLTAVAWLFALMALVPGGG